MTLCYFITDYSSCPEVKDFKSWTEKHPDSWSSNEVLDWIFDVANERNLDVAHLHAENFRTVTGYHLCRFTQQEFHERDPDYGTLYYEIFRQLYNGGK